MAPKRSGRPNKAGVVVDKVAKQGPPKKKGIICNFVKVIEDVRKMEIRDVHHEQLRKTPFWHLIDAILTGKAVDDHCQKNVYDIRIIMKYFDKGSGSFNFGGRNLYITGDDVKLIFGIRGGEKNLFIGKFQVDDTDLYVTCFKADREESKVKKDFRLGRKYVKRKIAEKINSDDPRDVQHVASLVTIFFLSDFFLLQFNDNLPWAYTSVVADLGKICDYDWGEHIALDLVRRMKKSKNDDYDGCIQLLQYFMCERTHLLDPETTEVFPRFLKWDLRKLSSKLTGNLGALLYERNQLVTMYQVTVQERRELYINEVQTHVDNEPTGRSPEHTVGMTSKRSQVSLDDISQMPINDTQIAETAIGLPFIQDVINEHRPSELDEVAMRDVRVEYDDETCELLMQGFDNLSDAIIQPSSNTQEDLPTTAELHAQIFELRTNKDELEAKLKTFADLNERISKLKSERDEFEEKLKAAAALHEQVSRLKSVKEILDEKLKTSAELHDQIDRLKFERDELEEKMKKSGELKAPAAEIKTDRDQTQETMKKLQDENDKLISERSAYVSKISELEAEIEGLKRDEDLSETRVIQSTSAKKSVQLAVMQSDNKTAAMIMDNLVKDNLLLLSDNKTLKRQLENFKNSDVQGDNNKESPNTMIMELKDRTDRKHRYPYKSDEQKAKRGRA